MKKLRAASINYIYTITPSLLNIIGMVAMIVLLVILIFLLCFFCMMPYFKAMYNRWKYWEDPENDPRWSSEQFQFSTSPKLAREPIYNRLSNSTLDTMSEGDPSSVRGSRMGSRIGSRVGSRVGINREGSFRNTSGLPRYSVICEVSITILSSQGSRPSRN